MSIGTRRDWLRSTTAGLIGGAFVVGQDRALAEEKPATIPLGFSLYGMKSLKLADGVRSCAEIGYDCIELALLPGYPTEPKLLSADDRRTLRQQIADRGLILAALMENLAEPADDKQHRANLDRLKAAAELGHTLSPKVPPLIETILGGKPAQWDQVKDKMAERLRAWAETAAAAKTIIAIKPHVANALHTPEAALWLGKQVNSPWIKLAYDYSHLQLRKLALAETVRDLVPQSAFIHVKDARGSAEKFEFLLPGEGTIDYVEYLKLVKAAGYRGALVVEVSGQIFNRAGYDPIAAAKQCYAHLAPAFQKAEVRRK